jgi:hypothetical protein
MMIKGEQGEMVHLVAFHHEVATGVFKSYQGDGK